MSRIASTGFLEKKVYNEIKEMIMNGELQPGVPIIQEQIAARIGVSRTPLRRALAELERDHLLETGPQGLFVTQFTNEFILSMWQVRAVLEGLACRLCASRMDEATNAYYSTLLTSSYRHWQESSDPEPYRQADIAFHTGLMELSGNLILKQKLEGAHVLTVSLSKGLLRAPSETYPEHMEILAALSAGNEDEAERQMVEHLRKTIPVLGK
ncbi:GntR family transcriptional regulator [Paenibacillus piri]|nr:GntR family transcriptional regulator [Paenibacillus piri]